MGERIEALREALVKGEDATWGAGNDREDVEVERKCLREIEPYRSHLKIEAIAEGWRLRLPAAAVEEALWGQKAGTTAH